MTSSLPTFPCIPNGSCTYSLSIANIGIDLATDSKESPSHDLLHMTNIIVPFIATRFNKSENTTTVWGENNGNIRKKSINYPSIHTTHRHKYSVDDELKGHNMLQVETRVPQTEYHDS